MRALCLLALPGLLAACAPKGPPPGQRPLLLWRVEKDGAINHLLGTCHLPVPLAHALPPEHRPLALDAARVVYGEVDLDGAGIDASIALAFSGDSLATRMGAAPFRALSVRVRDTVPATALDRMSPWIASTLLVATDARSSPGAGPPMDLAIIEEAKKRRVAYRGLESLADQGALLAEHEDTLLAELSATDDPVRAAWQERRALLTACAATDPALVAKVVKHMPAGMEAALLTARNARWLDELRPELAMGGTLVAVGAAHMIGEDGLVATLQREGHTVTWLTADAASATWEPALPGPPPPLPPAPPAELVDAWVSATLPAVLGGSCGEGGILERCGLETAESCPDRVRADIRLCVEQHSDRMPETVPDRLLDPAQAGAVLPCMMAGPTAALMARSPESIPDSCPMKAMLQAPARP